MKRIMLYSAIPITAVIIVCFIIFLPQKTDMSFSERGETVFKHNDTSVCMQLSDDDLLLINNLFDGKSLYKDNPSCGFTEDVSLTFNGTEKFCIACDTCPVIFWKNKNKYFSIAEEEYSQLRAVLEKYGFYFPCV